jgi:hypothetical protein
MRAGNTCGGEVKQLKRQLKERYDLEPTDRGSFLNQGLDSRAGKEWESLIL